MNLLMYHKKISTMKNKSKLLIGLLMGMLVFLGACEEENDYDFNAIEPVIASISGPNLVAAHGLTEFPSTYRVPHRGGSTFEWSVTTQGGSGATIVLDDEFSSVANITFNQSSVADVATITVKETTMGGKTAELSRTVNLDPFCPQNMSPWAGTWGSHNFLGEDDYGVTNVDIEVITSALNTIRIRNFFDWVVVGFWAENWIPGVGGNGHFVLEVDCTFPEFSGTVLLGETVEWTTYWMDYTGSFDLDAKTITVNYTIAWTQGGDPWNAFTANMSLSKEMVETIRNMQSFPTR
jgi:hypothetical protein